MLMGFVGGLMIGIAAAVFLLVNGRILGISGIFGGLVDGTGWGNWAERAGFVAGLVGMPALLVLWWPSQAHVTGNWVVLVAGGGLVGLGTRLANGCTSGHGVCGMARVSPRSIVATLIYVGAGFATMLVMRHLLGVI
ncbi:MAG: YeeE/YedE family protein [Pseudorhodobacter sp.]|nr:YeeE/YedE family protein [Pseudorhodobacter sp.]